MYQRAAYCTQCRRHRLFFRGAVGPNHTLHLVISVLTCGLWLPLWLGLALFAPLALYRCANCGAEDRQDIGDYDE